MGSLEIAKTILSQLGGTGRITAMTGAKQFVALERGVQFRFPNQGRNAPNSVCIELTAADEYDVAFHRIDGADIALIEKVAGLHAEDLRRVFEASTGLRLSLRPF